MKSKRVAVTVLSVGNMLISLVRMVYGNKIDKRMKCEYSWENVLQEREKFGCRVFINVSTCGANIALNFRGVRLRLSYFCFSCV